MCLLRRAVCLVLLLGSTGGLYAFEVTYGSLFQVRGITLKNGRPVLPLARKQYANVRVLDKETFELLKTCAGACTQPASHGETELAAIRPAKTRPDMWIADVAVDNKWQLTFLVFKNGEKFEFVSPEGVKIIDGRWLARVHRLLQARVQAGGKEG